MNIQSILTPLLLLFVVCAPAWGSPVKAYVSEFSVSGVTKPEETKTIIQSLLLSRLSNEDVSTQSKPEGADVKISGSYLMSGTAFSLDAVATNSTGEVIARAFAEGKSPDELIPAVGTLSKSLSDGISKKNTAATAMPQSAVQSPDIIIPPRSLSMMGQATVHKMTGALNGLALGQTLPGGERELLVIGNHTLRYYRQGAELKLMAEIPYKVHEKLIAVDSADLDNNAIPEIYVTIMNGETLTSQVWAVEGASLKQIAGPLPYYFRTVTAVGGVKKLYAQKISGTADFAGEVSEVVMESGNYQLKNPVKLPKNGYLYNYAVLKALKGESNPVITDRSGYLKVFTTAGDDIWKSSEEYGGSEAGFQRTDPGNSDGYRNVFLDQRMVVKANGELLVAKNAASWFMLNKHTYSRNSVYCFEWDGVNLEEKWHTKQSDYYLADFAYDDSHMELLMLEVVGKEDGIFDKGASRLVIRKMN